jgi:cytochrome c-type biogenesis protein CcmF
MPWLTATAFLHSIQAQEHRGMFAPWTAALVILSFGLAIFGTFLTRSGLLSSVHAFANASIGLYLLGFLAAALAAGFALLLRRLPELTGAAQPQARLESLLSREAALLANNALLLVAAFVVLLGTIFPLLAELVSGDRIAVGPPYFNLVLTPIVALLLVIMAAGPLLPWRAGRGARLAQDLAAPGAAAVLAVLALGGIGVRSAAVLILLGLCVFVAGTIAVEFRTGLPRRSGERSGWVAALGRVVGRNRRRYGGYVVHFGLLVVLAAATVSSTFSTAAQATVAPRGTMTVGRYLLRYDGVAVAHAPGLRITTAAVTVLRDGAAVAVLRPRHVVHEVRAGVTADIAIRSTWSHDLYVVLAGLSPDGRAIFRLSVNPMVPWLWGGALVMLVGGLIAALPRRRAEGIAASSYAAEPAAVAGGDR